MASLIRRLRWSLVAMNAPRLSLPPIIMAFIDLYVTLRYQPSVFWQGDSAAAVEGNPIALIALRIGPFVLLGCVVAWCLGVLFLAVRLPRRWAIDLALFLVLGHCFCVGQWFIRYEENWAPWLVALLCVTSCLAFPLFQIWRQSK